MYSDMLTEDDEIFDRDEQLFKQIQSDNLVDRDHMLIEDDECTVEETDIYQQLAEKDHYLMLAAEAGKVLLEKNQELSNHYQTLQEDYLDKIEELEQERHHLRRELCDREHLYETRMQDLHEEVNTLSGQLAVVQKSSKSYEISNKSTFSDIASRNDSLIKELDEVKSYNQDLAQQVQTLSKRIEGRLHRSSSNSVRYDISSNNDDEEDEAANVDFMEMKSLKQQVQQLHQHKEKLEESLTELAQEKQVITMDQQRTVGKVSSLEEELMNLKQQISMCQEDLNKTKRKNFQLKDQLEEYVMLQQSTKNGSGGLNNSLFNELEMSLSEADMNLQHMSTPYKLSPGREVEKDEETDDTLPSILLPSRDDEPNTNLEKLRIELLQIYEKLKKLRSKLSGSGQSVDSSDLENENDIMDGLTLSKIVDQIIDLIQERVLSLGIIDARSNSPIQHLDLDTCDNLSQADSNVSDRDVDLLEQQVHDLNQRLNIITTDLDSTKKELTKTNIIATDNEEKALSLAVQVNFQDREIDALRKEREIMLADTTMDTKLKKLLEERDSSLQRENEMKAKYETVQNDMQKLNNQLLSAVEQKLELSEQLEQWQFDMASLIDQQLASKIKKEQQSSRKRTSTNPARMFAAKFFASRNNSRESSRTGTPTVKSPVPPKQ